MALPNLTKKKLFWAKLATFWIPSAAYRRALRGILLMGVKNYINVIKNDKINKFPYELSVVAIMKDEGPYLKEWLDFHILVGVQKFYLYDNGSTDNTTEVLAPYIKSGIVDYTYFPGERQQNPAYIDAINKHGAETRWLALIDLDEFIVPVKHKNLVNFLHTLPKNFGALVMTWAMYGSAGHVKKPKGLVIENYKYRGNKTRKQGCKSIVNPRLVVSQRNPHINSVAGFTIDENGKRLGFINQTSNPPSFNKIRCNHYVTKSFEEYKQRCDKGSASTGTNSAHKKWSQEKFDFLNNNDIYDPIMDKYVEMLKNK